MTKTQIRTPADLGAIIRDRRKQLDLDQATLAKRVGASRRWIIGIERGRARAELGLVLRALDVLGLRLDAQISPTSPSKSPRSTIDIDAIVNAARKAKA